MEDKFDWNKYVADWKRKNMRTVNVCFKKDFVEEFKNACKKHLTITVNHSII